VVPYHSQPLGAEGIGEFEAGVIFNPKEKYNNNLGLGESLLKLGWTCVLFGYAGFNYFPGKVALVTGSLSIVLACWLDFWKNGFGSFPGISGIFLAQSFFGFAFVL